MARGRPITVHGTCSAAEGGSEWPWSPPAVTIGRQDIHGCGAWERGSVVGWRPVTDEPGDGQGTSLGSRQLQWSSSLGCCHCHCCCAKEEKGKSTKFGQSWAAESKTRPCPVSLVPVSPPVAPSVLVDVERMGNRKSPSRTCVCLRLPAVPRRRWSCRQVLVCTCNLCGQEPPVVIMLGRG